MSSDIVTYPLNGITYTAEEAAGYHSARTSGVYCLDEDFKVSLSSGGKSVWISSGRAWVHPSRFTGYSIIMRWPVTLALSTPTLLCSRIDRVVLRFDRRARRSYLTVLKGTEIFGGTPSSSAAPQITRNEYVYDLCLAEIRYFAGTNIIPSLIDTRGDESLCGLMRDGVTRIPELTIGTVTTGETASATIKNGVLSLVLPNGNGGSSTGGSSTGGSGLSETSKTLLLSLLENAAYTSPSMQAQLNALRTEWSSNGGGSDEIPVQSVSLSSSVLTLNEGESKALTATVLPADATNKIVIWTVTPTGIATVVNGTVTASKAGSCTVTAMAGGKSASCTVTVKAAAAEAEATLLYTLSSATTTSSADKTCLDTGLQLLAKASTETPQYTILWEAQVADNADASTWPSMVNCQTETGSFTNMPGFNGSLNPNTGTIDFAYYLYSNTDARLCDTLAHAKTKTRYAIQMNGAQYRVGSTHCTLSAWKSTGAVITDVPETLIFGAAYTATGEHTRFLDCTISQCMVYKGLLSDSKLQSYINGEWGNDAETVPVQSVSLSQSALTLKRGGSATLTATVLPADATNRAVVWTVSPSGYATVSAGKVTAAKAGTCTVTATAGGKSASCTVNIAQAETAQLIYTLPAETELTSGFDTGLKLLEHASTESPQYTILVDAKAGDNFDASTWPAFLHCLTETGSTANLPGFNSTSSPLNNKTEFAYYNYGGVTLSDSIEHLKTRTRYVVQLDGKKYRGGSTYCPMTEWLTSNGTITDVPQTFLIGAAQSADGSKKQQFWPGTLYQCKVYKGLLSNEKVNEYIEKGW
ncbi:MAG: Ig-like domain-containing protein [Faecalibacterium sp.]